VRPRTFFYPQHQPLRIANCTSHPQFPPDSHDGGLRIDILLDFEAILLSHAGSAITNKVEVQHLALNPATNHSMSNSPAQEASPSSEVATFDLKLGETDEPLDLSVQHSFLELALAQQPRYSFPLGVPAMLLTS